MENELLKGLYDCFYAPPERKLVLRIIDAQKTDQLTVAAKGYRNQRVNALLAQNTPLLGTMLIQLCHVLDTDKTVLFKRVEPKRACFQRYLLQKILLAADALGTRFIRII